MKNYIFEPVTKKQAISMCNDNRIKHINLTIKNCTKELKDGFSVKFVNKLLTNNNNTKISISLDRIFSEDEIEYVKKLLEEINLEKVQYVFYSDLAIHEILQERNYQNKLVYDAYTYLTNYMDVNAYLTFNENVYVSSKYDIILQPNRTYLYNFITLDGGETWMCRRTIYYTAQEMTEFLGIKKNAYHHFYRICKSLMGKNISLKDDSSKKFRIISFLIEAEYNNGILKLIPNPSMIPFYTNLTSNYTKLELTQIMEMKSISAIRIYSLIKIKAQQNKNVYLFELNEFKELLGLEKKYNRIQDFRIYVLETAKEELNKVIPNIKFDYELVKIGKTYKQLRFTFNGKALNYTVIQDDMYFRTFDKFKNICNLGQYCNADESPECRYCKLKIKNRYE